MPLHPNVKVCTHLKVTGVRCGSPALRGEQFCYLHERMTRGVQVPPNARLPPRPLRHRARPRGPPGSRLPRHHKNRPTRVPETTITGAAIETPHAPQIESANRIDPTHRKPPVSVPEPPKQPKNAARA
jgi:hypothetical protein